ncbi:MAG: glycosyltransferase, partial [Chloroflexota bacterium]
MLQVAVVSVHTCPLARLGSRETGGMNVYIRELSRHLGRRGVRVDVFTRRQAPEVPRIVEFGENARVIHLDAGPARPMDKYDVLQHLPQFARGMADFQREAGRDYHLIHSHYWLSSPVATSLSVQWQVPLVTMFHTLGRLKNRVSRDGSERENSERIEIERLAMLAADRVVAVSPTDMEQMVGFYG